MAIARGLEVESGRTQPPAARLHHCGTGIGLDDGSLVRATPQCLAGPPLADDVFVAGSKREFDVCVSGWQRRVVVVVVLVAGAHVVVHAWWWRMVNTVFRISHRWP